MKTIRYVFRKGLLPAILFALLFPALSFSETKEIIAEGTYNMGDGETPVVAEKRALLNAKRTALEQAGTYVRSHSKMVNSELTGDEIEVIASGITEVEILDKKRTFVGDSINFWVKIRARVQSEKMEEMAKRVKKDKELVDNYKQVQEVYNKSQKDIEELKRQLAEAKGEKDKKQVEVKITDEERLFQAKEWLSKGYSYWSKEPYDRANLDRAIEAYTNAITLAPDFALAYVWRGLVRGIKTGEKDKAIEDYTKAIALEPNYADAYYGRGVVYAMRWQFDRAIEDYDKAIALAPNFADAYHDRGNAYYFKNEDAGTLDDKAIDRVIKDFDKAIALNPDYGAAYSSRGGAYFKKGQYDKAIQDYSTAIPLKPNSNYYDYYSRGNAYTEKGQYDKAIEDYNALILYYPTDERVYTARGVAYDKKGLHDHAIEDFNKAISLNPYYADAYNNRGLAYISINDSGKACIDLKRACELGNCRGYKLRQQKGLCK